MVLTLGCQLFVSLCFISTVSLSSSETDVPCSSMKTQYGFVCTCNDTYCDTITAPTPLEAGNFYHYVTSSESPGFTRTQGAFSSITQLEPEFSVSDDPTEVNVWLNASVTYQTIKGMGTAVTDTCGKLLQTLTSGTVDNFMESVFGVKGLEYTYLRVPMASSDFSSSYYTQDDVYGDVDLKHWKLTTEDLTIKIPFIQKASALSSRGLNVLATPWSAPDWMKTSDRYSQGYVYKKYLEPWARYYIKFLQAYKDQGVPIWGLTLGNEEVLAVYFGSNFDMANLIMMPNQQRYWVKKFLGPMIQEAGFGDVKLYTLDDERPFVTWFTQRLFTDKEYSKYVSGVSVHWYFDWNTTKSQLDLFHKSFPDKSIIYAESGINDAQADYRNDPVALGHWPDASRYILDMFDALCHWSEIYLDWNLALNPEGGPLALDHFRMDASLIINSTSQEFYKQPIFYSIGHFSKFIPPGAVRVNVKIKQVTNDSYDQECSFASQELNKRRMPQTILKSGKSSNLRGPNDLPTKTPDVQSTAVRVLATLNPDGSRTVITYNPRSEAANLIVVDSEKGTFKRSLQPLSLNTFLYW